MKKLSIVLSTFALVSFVFGLILFSSCKKEKVKYNDSTLTRPCDNVICLNGGTCKDGLCYCPVGFEGDKCATKWSDKFVGNYIADDECYTGSSGYYNVVINSEPDFAYKIRLFNLGIFCPNQIITATINPEKTSFEIPLQKTCGELYLSGYGNVSGNFVNVFLNSRDSVNHTSTQCSILLNRVP